MKSTIVFTLILFLLNCNVKNNSKTNDILALLILNELPIGTAEVTTFAGTQQAGAISGSGSSARFSFPTNIQADSQNNLYIIDSGNTGVRKYFRYGKQTNWISFYAMNPGNTELISPYGLAIDTYNNLYVTSSFGGLVKKITSEGVYSDIIPNNGSGFVDGNFMSAKFNGLFGVVVDSKGNIFVADAGNHAIRKITQNGLVSTFAGNSITPIPGFKDGWGKSSRFYRPTSLAIDKADNLYVGDSGNFSIRRITSDGYVSTLAGNGTQGAEDGKLEQARFYSDISALAIDTSGNIFVGESQSIRKISLDGKVSTIAGKPSTFDQTGYRDGVGTGARFNSVKGLTFDSDGNLYASDYNNHMIRKIVLDSKKYDQP
ncbi:MAG: hypothetical protein SH817_09900 [Leptospira sp.]|nr:hypothetical protein [Leptospira sp.]